MVDDLDFDLAIDNRSLIIRYCNGDQELNIDLLDLVREAADYLTASEMNHVYEKLDDACCLARRLSKEIRSAQTTD